jgi:hypothetical protein
MAKVPLKGSERAAVPGAEFARAHGADPKDLSAVRACTGLGSPRGDALAGIL